MSMTETGLHPNGGALVPGLSPQQMAQFEQIRAAARANRRAYAAFKKTEPAPVQANPAPKAKVKAKRAAKVKQSKPHFYNPANRD